MDTVIKRRGNERFLKRRGILISDIRAHTDSERISIRDFIVYEKQDEIFY